MEGFLFRVDSRAGHSGRVLAGCAALCVGSEDVWRRKGGVDVVPPERLIVSTVMASFVAYDTQEFVPSPVEDTSQW